MNVRTRFWRALGWFCGHEARGQQWFMQDGAAPHMARRVLTWLTDHFEGRVISRFIEKTWASHSPDLNPLDFFLWGHLKDQMSGEQFQTLNDLKSLVERLIRAVTPDQCIKFCYLLSEWFFCISVKSVLHYLSRSFSN